MGLVTMKRRHLKTKTDSLKLRLLSQNHLSGRIVSGFVERQASGRPLAETFLEVCCADLRVEGMGRVRRALRTELLELAREGVGGAQEEVPRDTG